MAKHSLKILPKYFAAVDRGDKTFEVRLNDRDYRVGDIVILREYIPALTAYTGKEIWIYITYIVDDPEYCKSNYIIFSFKKWMKA